ncbi:MAG: hypothetical protein HUK11_09225 [Muribaculaceae bacterium]|nr:hypothetical protein [Muribaculaceae bacterium]
MRKIFTFLAMALMATLAWAAPTTVTYDFTQIEGFSKWGNSYSKHVVEYDAAAVTFEGASRQTTTITDCPVIKGAPVTVALNSSDKNIVSVSANFMQWTTKAKTVTLNTSTDGENFTATSTTASAPKESSAQPFSISTTTLGDGVKAIQFTFDNASNQVGFVSVTITYDDDDTPPTPTLAAPKIEVVKDGPDFYASFTCEEGASVYYNFGDGEAPYLGEPVKINFRGHDVTITAFATRGDLVSEEATKVAYYYQEVYTYSDINLLMDDSHFMMMSDSYAIAHTGKYLFVGSSDEAGVNFDGTLIYQQLDQFNQGDVIGKYWIGKKVTFNGAPEVIETEDVKPNGETVAVKPGQTFPSLIGWNDFSRFVKVRYATFNTADKTIAALDVDPSASIIYYDRFNVVKDYQFEEGAKYNVECVVGFYGENCQLYPLTITPERSAQPVLNVDNPAGTYEQPIVVKVRVADMPADGVIKYSVAETAEPMTYTEDGIAIGSSCTLRVLVLDANGDIVAIYTGDYVISTITAVDDITVDKKKGPMFNILGQPVDESYRGIVIQDGKKVVK